MASKDLKVNVIVNAKTKELDKMFKRLNKMQTKLNQQASAQNAITRAVQKTNAAHKKSGSLIDGLTTKVHRLANAYLGVLGARAALTASDTITSAENKLNHMNNGDTAATQNQMDKMYTSAQKVRMEYADMMTNVSKSMTLAGDAFGGNIDNAIRFQEIMGEAYTLSGSSAAEMSSSMYQMIQGLGSGVLQGDELRSVREGASMAYQAIEEFAKGIYGADKNLKDLAADGLITSDIVVAAILKNGEKMDEAFAKTSMTFAQAWTNMKNTALKAFEPVLQKMNDLLNSDVGKSIVNGIGKAIQIVANAVLWLFDIVEGLYNYIVDNWDTVKNVLLTLGTIIGSILLVRVGLLITEFLKLFGVIIANAIASGAAWLAAWLPLVVAVGVLIWLTLSWAKTTQTVCDFIYEICMGLAYGIMAIMAMVLVAYLATGTIMLSIPMLIALAVVAVLALIIAAFVKFTGEIVGGVLGIWEVCKTACANIGGFFHNLWYGALELFWMFIGDVLTGLADLEPAFNAIAKLFGMEGVTLSGLTETAYGKSAKARSKLKNLPGLGDAWDTGYAKGHAIGENIQNSINGFGEKFKGALNGEGLDKVLGLTDLPFEPILPDSYESLLGGIDDNTGKVADSMELTEEDLKYLRDVANMEWKKEFTTANITVDMTNNNNVSNDYDLNSLAIGLRNLVEEEMFAVANGTYV